jgi:hypothetical protein
MNPPVVPVFQAFRFWVLRSFNRMVVGSIPTRRTTSAANSVVSRGLLKLPDGGDVVRRTGLRRFRIAEVRRSADHRRGSVIA